MSGIADRRLEERIVERVTEGPVDVAALFAALRARDAAVLAGQEGLLHALLHRLVRDRVVHPAGHGVGGGTIYASTVGPAADADALAPVREAPPPAPMRAVELATRVAGAVRDSADRGRVVADVLAHVASLPAAEARARFGSWKLARSVLARADRGRSIVAVVENGWERLRRFLLLEGVALFTTIVGLLVVWLFLGEFRVIPSHSMEPTMRPGDRVVVKKLGGRAVPDRFAIVVFRGSKDVLVKRVVGLPGESVQIENGDLVVDGVLAVKSDETNDAVREPVLRAGVAADADWRLVVGAATPALRRHVRALFADDPRYANAAGSPEDRRDPRPLCHDVYLSAQTSGAAVLAIEFVTEDNERPANDVAALAWTRDAEGVERVIVRRDGFAPAGVEETLERGGSGAVSGAVTIALVDGVFRVDAPRLRLRRAFDLRRGRARIVVGGGVRDVAVDRDLHYTSDREAAYAVETPYRVPDGHIFLLGDHSSNSRDCRFREVGPIPLERLIGPVIFRVWPPSRVGPVR